ncbi:MAG: sensor histidine kinase [Clostridiaceae bacterium]|nr:sensor histidine kinase [Clostridiaceae bacterium]
MENWMIGTRLVILLYCILYYVMGDMEAIPLIILLILVYTSSVAISYLLKNAFFKKITQLSSIVILLLCTLLTELPLILLISIDILELVSKFNSDWKVHLIFTALPAFFVDVSLLPEYAAFSLLTLIIYLLAANHFEALSVLKKTNESLRDRNEELLSRLDAGNEYEAQMRYLSQIEERNNLAQSIHDRVGHTLAGSIIQLEAAELILDTQKDKAGAIIKNVKESLKEGMDSVRTTLRTIKPPAEQLGINRLKLVLDEFSLNSEIKTSFSYTGRLDIISHIQWKILIDNTKEALTNVLKHSKASNVDVRLEVMNRLIKAEVRDNGLGAPSMKKGMGLSGMEERTENAGGKLIIDSFGGFSVITILPAGEEI